MKKIYHLIGIISVLLIGCKQEKEINKPNEYISELNLTEDISDFTSKMTEKDTVKIIANLIMEYPARIDELTLTKRDNKLILQTIIKEDTTFEGNYQMRETKLPELNKILAILAKMKSYRIRFT